MRSSSLTFMPSRTTIKATTCSPQCSWGKADDGGLIDGRMRQQHLLDLAWIDVLAARDDHVVLAIDQIEVALIVETAKVACREPFTRASTFAIASGMLR